MPYNLRKSTEEKTKIAYQKVPPRPIKARKPRKRGSLAALMGTQSSPVKPEETIVIATTITTPARIVEPLQSKLHSLLSLVPTTPEKGAHTTQLSSPGGTIYHNQGLIHIQKTGRDKSTSQFNCGLFFPESKGNSNHTVQFEKTPPKKLQHLFKFFQSLHAQYSELKDLILPRKINISLADIQAIRVDGKKRVPSNKTVMKKSAMEIFKEAGLKLPKGTTLHWLHRKAAYLTGKYDTKHKRSKSQIPSNMILGTAQSNCHMGLIELTIEKLLKNENIKLESITLDEHVVWKKNYDGLIADKIIYSLQAKGNVITFEIDPWTLNQVPENKEQLINAIVAWAFTDDPAQRPDPSSPYTPAFQYKIEINRCDLKTMIKKPSFSDIQKNFLSALTDDDGGDATKAAPSLLPQPTAL